MTRKVGGRSKQHQIQVQTSYSDDGTYMYLKVPFNREFLEAIKASIPKHGRTWDPTDKLWRIEGGYHSVAKELIDTYFEGKIDTTNALPDSELYRQLYLIPGAPLELVVQAYGVLTDKYKGDMSRLPAILTAYTSILEQLECNKNNNAEEV